MVDHRPSYSSSKTMSKETNNGFFSIFCFEMQFFFQFSVMSHHEIKNNNWAIQLFFPSYPMCCDSSVSEPNFQNMLLNTIIDYIMLIITVSDHHICNDFLTKSTFFRDTEIQSHPS